MTRIGILAALLASTALPAFALDTPVPGKEDAHVRQVAYSQFNRTLIITDVGHVTNITFSPQESVKRVVFGQDDGPIEAPNPQKLGNTALINNLPLSAVKAGTTDLLVITQLPDQSERTYQFSIRVKASDAAVDDAEATYGLIFSYPTQEKAVAQAKATATWRERQKTKEKEVAEARLATDVFYGERNWKYLAQGDHTVAPLEASDNGRLTAFRYPGNTNMPTVYVVDSPAWCDQKKSPPSDYLKAPERTAAATAKDDLIVVQQTAPHFRLRLGQHVAEVYNCGFDPIGQNPGTGTTSPNVIRRVVAGKDER